MKRTLPLFFACLSLSLFATEYTREEMVEILEKQEDYVETLSEEFFTLNDQIEDRIGDVVSTLASLEDGRESKTRVSNLKSKVIDDLKTSLKALQQQRNANAAMMARLPSNRSEDTSLHRANQFLDEKMKGRVDQIMELAHSLHQSKDVKKYDYVVRQKYNDDLKVRKERSEEYKRNRSQTINANQDRESLIKGIEDAEYRLTQEINHIKAEQKRTGGGDLPPAQAQKLADNEELLSVLKEKKREIYKGKTVETSSVNSTAAAMELERKVNEAVQELRYTNAELRQKGQELKQAFMRLDAQQAALAEYDKANP